MPTMAHSESTTRPPPAFDAGRPCRICGLPVVELSYGSPDVCPWCDCGIFRNGDRWTWAESMDPALVRERIRTHFGMEGPRLEPRQLGVRVVVRSLDGIQQAFIPFAPDTIEFDGGSEARDRMEKEDGAPNYVESDPEDVYRVPIEVSETRYSFVVVRLRADSPREAEERALSAVERLCRGDSLGEHLDLRHGTSDWEHDAFEAHGLSDVQGDVMDYGVDIDMVDEPTDAERKLAEAQVVLPLEGD